MTTRSTRSRRRPPSPRRAPRRSRTCCAAQDLLKGEALYDVENVAMVHHVNNALKAHPLFQKDKDYIVRNGEIVIIDEFTGRMMPGRRYSEGLHQALEAKEHVAIQPENQTLASITFQNYFRMYEKLAGMTGTAHDRSGGIRRHLRPRRAGDPDQPADHAPRRARRGLPHRRGEVPGDRRGDPRCPQARPADPGRHHLDREVGTAGRAPAQGRPEGLRGAERAPPRARGADRRPGRQARRHHHRHQHGRPRHRHPARRQCRHAHRRGTRRHARGRRAHGHGRGDPQGRAGAEGKGAGGRRPLRARHRTPREPAHRQPAARPLRPPGRPRAAPSSTCRCRTI